MHTTSPFIVNAMELAASPQDFDVNVEAGELDLIDETWNFTENVTGPLSWRWLHNRAVLSGQLATKVTIPCARCLENAEIKIVTEIYIVFTDEPPVSDDLLDLDAEDDEGMAHYVGDKIDAREEIRAAILVEIPEFPLCAEDCKGLCPDCGADLNKEPCSCEQGLVQEENPGASEKSASWRDQIDKLRNDLK